jgi:hypothetical protein
MVDSLVTRKLARAFPNSFINTALEFIAHKEANEYFRLEDCENEFDVKCKVLEWLSRGAHKTCPFHSNIKNERFHNFMLNGINDFLGTDFTEDDMEIIYTYLGNRCNHERTVKFVNSGYDMEVLKGCVQG